MILFGQGAAQMAGKPTRSLNKWLRFTMVTGALLLVDAWSKVAIRHGLQLHDQKQIVGDYVRLTYIHNPGAAVGISLGPHSTVIFSILSIIGLAALIAMYAATPPADRRRLYAVSLVAGGALGNLWNRMVVPAGVTDWIDVGVGATRWPVFNVADIAVTTGAFLLAVSLWHEDVVSKSAGTNHSRARSST